MDRYDLHTHTQASDGIFTPAENVRLAKEAGLAGLAITDHDTIDGVREAQREGVRLEMEVIPGVEISTSLHGKEIHVLGYFIDVNNTLLNQRLRTLREARQRRNEQLLTRLRELGIAIEWQEVVSTAQKSDADTIGRPHIADTLVKKRIVANMREAFDLYLGERGKAYVSVERITPFTAADWIHEAGGVVSLAHPGLYGDDNIVREILQYGVDAIETFHSDHNETDEKRYEQMAVEYGILQTAGSDFHGKRQGEVFHGPLGCRTISTQQLYQLKERARIN